MAINNANEADYIKLLTSWGLLSPTGVISWASSAGMPVTIYYSYDNTLNNNVISDSPFDGDDEADVGSMKWVARQAMNEWSKIANITFEENDSAANKIVFASADLSGAGLVQFTPNEDIVGGLINKASLYIDEAEASYTFTMGSRGYTTILHEIGHAIGLSHPGGITEADGYNPLYNQTKTIQSYNGLNNPVTPMVYDIAAAQFLYGARASSENNGNTTHFFDPESGGLRAIWDHDGIQTLAVTETTEIYNITINLRDGSDEGGVYLNSAKNSMGTTLPSQLFLAYGSNFQNAIGGAGEDTIVGNDNSNQLDGGEGIDHLHGGSLGDQYHFTGSYGSDFVYDDGFLDTLHYEVSSVLTEFSGEATYVSPGLYYMSGFLGFTVGFVGSSVVGGVLTITNGGNVTTIYNWVNGKYGITLEDAPAPEEAIAQIYDTPVNEALDPFIEWRKNKFYSPLLVDLDGGGTKDGLVSAENGVFFDVDGDGFAERIGWTGDSMDMQFLLPDCPKVGLEISDYFALTTGNIGC